MTTSNRSRLTAVLLAILLVSWNQVHAAGRDGGASTDSVQGSQGGRGVQSITQGSADLVIPPHTPDGLMCRYGVAFPFQVAPKMAALCCSLRNENLPAGDFENGVDVILFDNLRRISAQRATPLSRNEKYTDQKTGRPRIRIKYPIIGGFVPLGARFDDGTPHPHAGTGFGLCEVLDFPMYGTGAKGYYKKADKRTSMVRLAETRQFSFDGTKFRVLRTDRWTASRPLKAPGSDWALIWPGLRHAIPDGDTLLYPILATQGDPGVWTNSAMATGVSRWARSDGAWRPVSFDPVAPRNGGMWMEPSLVRDLDGALLFCARGVSGPLNNTVRVWRSVDGEHWTLIIDLPNARGQSPITLNSAADGTPYIVTNVLGHERGWLGLWPLNEDRSGLAEMITVRHARKEFGAPPSKLVWFVDHPTAMTLRLADGQWHNVLTYRIMDRGEHRGDDPAPQTGQYVEEVVSRGPAISIWNFDDE